MSCHTNNSSDMPMGFRAQEVYVDQVAPQQAAQRGAVLLDPEAFARLRAPRWWRPAAAAPPKAPNVPARPGQAAAPDIVFAPALRHQMPERRPVPNLVPPVAANPARPAAASPAARPGEGFLGAVMDGALANVANAAPGIRQSMPPHAVPVGQPQHGIANENDDRAPRAAPENEPLNHFSLGSVNDYIRPPSGGADFFAVPFHPEDHQGPALDADQWMKIADMLPFPNQQPIPPALDQPPAANLPYHTFPPGVPKVRHGPPRPARQQYSPQQHQEARQVNPPRQPIERAPPRAQNVRQAGRGAHHGAPRVLSSPPKVDLTRDGKNDQVASRNLRVGEVVENVEEQYPFFFSPDALQDDDFFVNGDELFMKGRNGWDRQYY